MHNYTESLYHQTDKPQKNQALPIYITFTENEL